MFQVRVAGFLHEDRGIVRRAEKLIDRDLMCDSALRQSEPVAPRLEYPKPQQRSDSPEGARRVPFAHRAGT